MMKNGSDALMRTPKAGRKRVVSIRLHQRDLDTLRAACRRYGGLSDFLALLAAELRAAHTPHTPPPPRPVRSRVAEAVEELERRYGLPAPLGLVAETAAQVTEAGPHGA